MWLKSLLLLLCVNVYAVETPSVFYTVESTGNYRVGITQVIKADEQITIETKEKETAYFILPKAVGIKAEAKSTFTINTATIDVGNVSKEPQTLKASSQLSVISILDGTVNLIVDNNSVINIHTPRVNLIASNGCYRITVQGKNTTIANIDGSIIATGLVKFKKETIQPKSVGLITTYIPLVNTENIAELNKPTLASTQMDADDLKQLETYFSVLKREKDKVLFAVVDGKILGIKILD